MFINVPLDLKYLIENGQKKQSRKRFRAISTGYVRLGFLIFIPLFILFTLILVCLYKFYPVINVSEDIQFEKDIHDAFIEGSKIWLGAFATYFITVILTNRWQQRAISFEMIKELNSPEFHKIRCYLVNEMELSIAHKKDIENMDGWLPYYMDGLPRKQYNTQPGKVDPADFYQKHALASMLYFILRMVNYKKFDMLNIHLTRHLFHFFFCHYELLMLEFGEALKLYIQKQVAAGFPYDDRWYLTSNDIKKFFKMMGLSGELRKDHTFIYFPSLNTPPEEVSKNQETTSCSEVTIQVPASN